MTDAAVISGTLVDVRNVGTHKSVKLTIHVPAELAPNIFKVFGWPTDVNPVHVAVARLDLVGSSAVEPRALNAEAAGSNPARSAKARQPFDEMKPSQQAGMLCDDVSFTKFLIERHSAEWRGTAGSPFERCAIVVRSICDVRSRADITSANVRWRNLVRDYRAWQREAEVVPA